MGIIHLTIPTVVHLIAQFKIVTKLIIYFNILFWLLPPLKQFKGGYFIYFLIIAITDPIAQILYLLFKIDPSYIYTYSSVVLLLSAILYVYKPDRKSIIAYLVILSLISTIILLIHNLKLGLVLIIITHIAICILFIYRFWGKYFNRNVIYIFLLALIFYELTIVIKMFVYLFDVQTGLIFLYSTDILDIIICQYFIFFNFKNGGKFRHDISGP